MNKAALFDKIEGEQFRKEAAKFNVGDSVRVHTKVVEGETYHPSFWLAVMATAPTHCPSQRNMYWREFDEVNVAK